MPAVSPSSLVEQILNAIQQSGGVSAYTSESVRIHPRKFVVNFQSVTYTLWVYIWTLTHGGRASLPDEYRIQMTSVTSPLPLNPAGLTVLMGYYPDLEMFAGFDLIRHRIFTEGSPSVQIDLSAIHSALQNGLSFVTKENGEVAVGVRPDQFMNYCLNSVLLHENGSNADVAALLERAVEAHNIPEDDISHLTSDRRLIVENIKRYSRDANFRKIVINAYEGRCAVSRLQLRLVEAAHILPVASSESSDHVTNGIALSPLFHKAYDNRLIYLDEDYIMRLNPIKAEELRISRLYDGIEQITRFVGMRVHLPADTNQRPRRRYIQMANKCRRIPGYI
jgi:putative restriction endonuclease